MRRWILNGSPPVAARRCAPFGSRGPLPPVWTRPVALKFFRRHQDGYFEREVDARQALRDRGESAHSVDEGLAAGEGRRLPVRNLQHLASSHGTVARLRSLTSITQIIKLESGVIQNLAI